MCLGHKGEEGVLVGECLQWRTRACSRCPLGGEWPQLCCAAGLPRAACIADCLHEGGAVRGWGQGLRAPGCTCCTCCTRGSRRPRIGAALADAAWRSPQQSIERVKRTHASPTVYSARDRWTGTRAALETCAQMRLHVCCWDVHIQWMCVESDQGKVSLLSVVHAFCCARSERGGARRAGGLARGLAGASRACGPSRTGHGCGGGGAGRRLPLDGGRGAAARPPACCCAGACGCGCGCELARLLCLCRSRVRACMSVFACVRVCACVRVQKREKRPCYAAAPTQAWKTGERGFVEVGVHTQQDG